MFTWNKTWEVSWFKIGLGIENNEEFPFPAEERSSRLVWIWVMKVARGWHWYSALSSIMRWPHLPHRYQRYIIKHGGLRTTLGQAPQPNCYHEWCLFRTLSFPYSLKECTAVKYTIFISSTPLFADFDQYSHLTVFLGWISNLGYPPGLLNV